MGYNRAIVEIRSVPRGEAPLWVREKWVGLRLPTVLKAGSPVPARTFGVLSTPRGRVRQLWALARGKSERESGFVVPVLSALEALEAASPEAAAWWRENAAHLVQQGACFLFEASCAQVCEDAP
jgi:hypothetical protein